MPLGYAYIKHWKHFGKHVGIILEMKNTYLLFIFTCRLLEN